MSVTVSFFNTELDLDALQAENIEKLRQIEVPAFEVNKENITELTTTLEPYQKYKNIILVANGGSVWSFMAYYRALGAGRTDKNVIALTDMEPDYLAIIKKQCSVDDTVVIFVSKSGSTIGVVEDVFALTEYKHIYVTDPGSTLGKIADSRGDLVIKHPAVGGRYSGFTSSAYVPSILTSLNVNELEAGGRGGYDEWRNIESSRNSALRVALALNSLEQSGYTEIFLPIYSNFLQTFGMVVTQLFHESFGKEGKGMTVLAAQAPESQHHTNQRFFGGRRNMVGMFVHVAMQQESSMGIEVPNELQDVTLRTGTLADINGIKLSHSFESEYIGTITDAKKQEIPLIDISVSEITERSVGELMAFWHYVTVFSSALRGVDPFDQPQVEESKIISFETRKELKQL